MKSYSVDLRQKIVEVYETKKISQSELAKRFRVAKSFVQKMLKQWREYGHLNAKPHGGGRAVSFSDLISFCYVFNRLWGKQSKVFLKFFRYLF